VSLSYLIEYVLKDYLPSKKRYINRLFEIDSRARDSYQPGTHGPYSPSKIESMNMPLYDTQPARSQSKHRPKNGHTDNFDPFESLESPRRSRSPLGGMATQGNRYFSTPNLLNRNPNDDAMRGQESKKQRMLAEIKKIVRDMVSKKKGLSKALGLSRVIDPLLNDGKKRTGDMRDTLSRVSNTVLDQETQNRLMDYMGVDSLDSSNDDLLKENLYKEFLSALQVKGVKLGKEYRQHGIPYVQRMDGYAKSIGNPIRADP
jgi:hypothetical protein